MRKSVMTAAAFAVAFAFTAPVMASSSGVPSKPWAGPACIKYVVGGTIWAINTDNPSKDVIGRLTSMNDAFLNSYSVKVSTNSDVDGTIGADTISCNGELNVQFPTPFLVEPN